MSGTPRDDRPPPATDRGPAPDRTAPQATNPPVFSGSFPEALERFNSRIDEVTTSIKFQRALLGENERVLLEHEARLAGLHHTTDGEVDHDAALRRLDNLLEEYTKTLAQLQTDNLRVGRRIRDARERCEAHPRGHPVYEPGDAETLRKALVRHGLLDAARQLPNPDGRLSGIAGRSRVYPIFIPNLGVEGGGVSLIAKFDPEDRAKREWKKLAELRSLSPPPGIMLPVNLNDVESDGVIIYRSAQSYTESGKVKNLLTFVRGQLVPNTDNCTERLSAVLNALRGFHVPGRVDFLRQISGPVMWSDVFESFDPGKPNRRPKILAGNDLRRYAREAGDGPGWWDRVNWDAATIAVGPDRRALPNPIADAALRERLGAPVGSHYRSRIHGDLNHTNVLVCLNRDHSPAELFVIDLGDTEADRLTAIDFARLESEFWSTVFPFAETETDPPTDPLLGLIAARDWLDGRDTKGTFPATAGPLEAAAGKFVRVLRGRANALLGSSQEKYCLEDFFYCLYFTSLASLRFEQVRADRTQVRVLLLEAALTLQTLKDLEHSYYGGKSPRYRFPLDEGP